MEFPKDAALTGFPDFVVAPVPNYFLEKMQKLFGKYIITSEPEADT
jgi:hypothetical protein